MWSTKVNATTQSSPVHDDDKELLRIKGELDATKFELGIRDEELTKLNQKHAEEIREFNNTYDNLRNYIATLEEDLALAEKAGTRDFQNSRDLKAQLDSQSARIKHLEGQLAAMYVQVDQAKAARRQSQAAYEANLVMTTRLKHDLDHERAISSEKNKRLDMRGQTIQQLEQRISGMRNTQGKRDLGEINTHRDPKRLRHW